ncbi:hypothetical protein KJZ71_00250 [Patescibacteria group bacterium]|uniref:Carboxysome Shell Carbonic Anhydrase catalytic domain-containing protein n=1 Tax=candidate division WWE3 bacterium TaxID=2053526 RepID=A0A928TPK3_UNCKA|nr:hypothetical protein [candidate division WWE3 bacterium]MCL4732220.1 hypothetical protein [Patescibacteria group bacterium]MDL1953120.1 hypothetical protein [Candidatus Uhrbacteria bacterium UHB]
MQIHPARSRNPENIQREKDGEGIPPVLSPVSPHPQSWPPEILRFLDQERQESAAFVKNEPVRSAWLARHLFRPSADLCVDGRVSDFSEALGLPIGILKPYRSAGAKSSSLESYIYAVRLRDFNRKIRAVRLENGEMHRMSQLHFATVHYSASHPDHSCAAWGNHTGRAEFAMQEHAAALNADFAGSIVSLVTLIDTDLDALTILAPRGKLQTAEIADMRMEGDDLLQAIRGHLLDLFPYSWEPLARLPQDHQEAFHHELAVLVHANVEFVRNVKSTGRPVELLEHQERLIFIGRPGETREHNTTFLIGDFEKEALKKDFAIALAIVAKNLLRDAIRSGNENWKIPVVISVPYDEDERELTVRYARGIRHTLEREGTNVPEIGLNLLTHAKNIQDDFPEWVIDHCSRIGERISWCVTVNDRKTRSFIPVD